MIKIRDLCGFLQEIAPLKFQEDYDNAGLIVGDINQEIKGVVVCLDSTEKVIEEAINMGCNVVVAHHPIVFSGLKKITGRNYVERAIIKAIKNDVAIYAIHTNLDNVLDHGVNEMIAKKLELLNPVILRPKEELSGDTYTVGSGVIGELKNHMSSEDFLRYLKDEMDVNCIKHTELVRPTIKRVAVCGGSGGFLLNDAILAKADIFITSDYKYHEYFDADGKIIIADIGHYESEQFTIPLLHREISKNFSTFATHCTKVNTNPVNYF